ncbi:hypothetical protein EDB80DRAFT_898864 [Ilyonectria destructans]|nr:hypothetical protein EDB80DRAFT_898864 [Ilyonectria destructans]
MVYQANNIRGQWKRVSSSAVLVGMGGVGGISDSLVFRTKDAPHVQPGLWACMTCSLANILMVCLLSVYFWIKNRQADKEGIILENEEDSERTQRKISTRLTIFLARPEPLEIVEEGYNPPWILAREVLKVALRRYVISEPAISVALWLSKIVFPQFQDKPAIAPYLGFENRLVHHAHLSDGITELGDFNYTQKTVGELFGEDCPFRYSKIEGQYHVFLVFYEPLPTATVSSHPPSQDLKVC